MTLIIGPQLEALLGNIHEDLKGKTKLEEPHVSKKVLLGAVRQQNQVIQFMQTMLHDQIQRMECMESAFKSQSQTLHILSEKVEAYQKTVDRVKVIDDILNSWREKIELVDVLDENVKVRPYMLICMIQPEGEFSFILFRPYFIIISNDKLET